MNNNKTNETILQKDIKLVKLTKEEKLAIRAFLIEFMEENPVREEEIKSQKG